MTITCVVCPCIIFPPFEYILVKCIPAEADRLCSLTMVVGALGAPGKEVLL